MQDGPVSKSLATCRSLSQQGISALERGDDEQAEELLSAAIASCAVDPEARRYYAEVLWRRGAQAEATEQIEEAVRLAPDDPSLWVRAAEMQLALGNIEGARSRGQRALNLNVNNADAWLVLGDVRRHAGDLDEALAHYHRALANSPGRPQILLAIAETYRQSNQPQRALVNLQVLSDTYPPGEEPADVLVLLGQAYRALGRHEDAAHSFLAALKRGASGPELSYLAAESQLLAGHAHAARQIVQEALSRYPNDPGHRALWERIELAEGPAPTALR